MKQLLQSYRSGELMLVETPESMLKSGHILIRTAASLVSVGTEKYMLELAKKGLLGKAKARPDLVKQVINKVKTEGILETYRQVMGRLDTPVPLGYSSAGVIVDAGKNTNGLKAGEYIACTGSGFAGHAEIVSVPQNLCAKIPDGVDFESAVFVALGGIALEAVRMANTQLGERVAVIGLGLLGQIAIQLLNAAGIHTLGVDVNPAKVKMALEHGLEVGVCSQSQNVLEATQGFTRGHGVDATIILAATSSNEPLELAAELTRERGCVVATGLVGLEIPRKPFYDKELKLVVSRAWGPGLYDPQYVEKSLDYPYSYGRWTAQRNMEEFLAQLAKGAVSVKHLITHRFPIERATEAYEMILEGKEPYIGVLLTYGVERSKGIGHISEITLHALMEGGEARERGDEGARERGSVEAEEIGTSEPSGPSVLSEASGRTVWLKATSSVPLASSVSIGLIGAGLFASGTLLPHLKKLSNVYFRGVATATGVKARYAGDKFDFDYCTTDYQQLLCDEHVQAVLIATRHNTHARFAMEALQAGKHVFVEKPLAVNVDELREIERVYGSLQKPEEPMNDTSVAPLPRCAPAPILMVGFNRRFSSVAVEAKKQLDQSREPTAVHIRVNAGFVPKESWVQDAEEGGGRVIGEVCHFVDLIQFLTGALPVHVYAEGISGDSLNAQQKDNLVLTIKLADGSIGSIMYVSNGDKALPRERVEAFRGGVVCVLDNFRSLTCISNGKKKRVRKANIDWGHRAELQVFLDAVRDGDTCPVDLESYVATTLTTFAIEASLKSRVPVDKHALTALKEVLKTDN
ncbi:bi-domain-containing oxidoreductase [Candidatus Poribacteria bacterium]|nr:bi-domain-containing oxidoreductase [Candidatus Poribacteria bacterium]